MEWKDWIGKRIFVKLQSGGVYTGDVVEVDDNSSNKLIWIVIIDKFGKKVQFLDSEVVKIVEEER